MQIDVVPIHPEEAEPWLLRKHYARRMCPISYAFGAYRGPDLIGVVTYGMPASPSLCIGVCGPEWKDNVIELNRLCCENTKNVASILVGRSLQMLPKPYIVVSYADTGKGHVGYVYQATNFLYTGLTDEGRKTPRSDRIANHGKHGRHQKDKDVALTYRSQKHRYVYFCGCNRQKNIMTSALRYTVRPYPKGDTQRYDASAPVETQMRLII